MGTSLVESIMSAGEMKNTPMTSDNGANFFTFYPLIQLILLSKYFLSDTKLDTIFRMLNNTWSLTSKPCHAGGETTRKPELQDKETRMYMDTTGARIRSIHSGRGHSSRHLRETTCGGKLEGLTKLSWVKKQEMQLKEDGRTWTFVKFINTTDRDMKVVCGVRHNSGGINNIWMSAGCE